MDFTLTQFICLIITNLMLITLAHSFLLIKIDRLHEKPKIVCNKNFCFKLNLII